MIAWVLRIVCETGLILITFNKRNYERGVELYGEEKATRRFKIARYIGYVVLLLSIAGLVWDILT